MDESIKDQPKYSQIDRLKARIKQLEGGRLKDETFKYGIHDSNSDTATKYPPTPDRRIKTDKKSIIGSIIITLPNGKIRVVTAKDYEESRKRIKQLETDVEDYKKSAKIALDDRDKHLVENRKLRAENEVLAKQNSAMNDTTVKQYHRIEQLEGLMAEAILIRGPNSEEFIERWQKALEGKDG